MKQITTTKQLSLKFDGSYVIPSVAARYLSASNHPIRPKIQWLTESRERNTLWWKVSAVELVNYTRVVRSWHARRAHAAFVDELKARGFDAKGRKLASDTQGSALTEKIGDHLKGTAVIHVRPGSIWGDYSSMRQEMKSVMDSLLKQQRSIQHHPHAKTDSRKMLDYYHWLRRPKKRKDKFVTEGRPKGAV
ncbi:hypothetical protein BJY01DRAFT_216695 [Aspergillus pseudoustus]|uniref:Mitochondrial zinc maintenance protein 1, mitochondrial n=1 Tax=Aspergillus pseudoustus TaxID=1810923 RepID=A0ABR4JTA3_9EURO